MENLTALQVKAIELIKSGDDFICSSFVNVIIDTGEMKMQEHCVMDCRVRHLKKHAATVLKEIFESDAE